MKLTKTESFIHKNRKQTISLQVKFSLCSEISLCREISIHSENFAIVAKFRNSSKTFAIVAKFRYNSEIAPVAPASSRINFFTSGLMQSKINHTNSM